MMRVFYEGSIPRPCILVPTGEARIQEGWRVIPEGEEELDLGETSGWDVDEALLAEPDELS